MSPLDAKRPGVIRALGGLVGWGSYLAGSAVVDLSDGVVFLAGLDRVDVHPRAFDFGSDLTLAPRFELQDRTGQASGYAVVLKVESVRADIVRNEYANFARLGRMGGSLTGYVQTPLASHELRERGKSCFGAVVFRVHRFFLGWLVLVGGRLQCHCFVW